MVRLRRNSFDVATWPVGEPDAMKWEAVSTNERATEVRERFYTPGRNVVVLRWGRWPWRKRWETEAVALAGLCDGCGTDRMIRWSGGGLHCRTCYYA